MKIKKYHKFHIVTRSPWPLMSSASALTTVVGLVLTMHAYSGGFQTFVWGFMNLVLVAGFWWRDIVREATFSGHHTLAVQQGLKMGFALFLLSEAMFFFPFFWSYLYFAINPAVEVGGVWPPTGISPISWSGIPLLNTYLLVWSGAVLTYAHYSLLGRSGFATINGMLGTILLGILFIILQGYEYYTAPFDISDGVYGSIFYLMTGLHGLHVIVGIIFLSVGFLRLISHHFTNTHHLGFIMAAWYWHFVDVVWLLLYVVVYMWGSY